MNAHTRHLRLTREQFNRASHSDALREMQLVPAEEVQRDIFHHGRGSAVVARPHQGAERCDRVAPDRISGVGPDASKVRTLPPANPIAIIRTIPKREIAGWFAVFGLLAVVAAGLAVIA